MSTHPKYHSTNLDDGTELEEGTLKGLRAVDVEHIVHNRKELMHGLCVLLVNLFHHGIQAHAASASYFCCSSQQAEVSGGFNQLQNIVASEEDRNSFVFVLDNIA